MFGKTGALAAAVAVAALFRAAGDEVFDVVVYGSSPAALTAAIEAKDAGRSVVIVSPEHRIGGLTTGGLGQTDIGNKSAFGGLALAFYREIAQYYADDAHWTHEKRESYLPDGQCKGSKSKDSMWTFEPSAALTVLEGWEKRHALDIRRGERLDRAPGKVKVETRDGARRIVSFVTLSGKVFSGRMFVDATYEGDLMAAAGVSYTVGRESNATYGETLNGCQPQQGWHRFAVGVSPYVKAGDPTSGLLPGVEATPIEPEGTGDDRVQAYCFRMCLTDAPENRIPFAKPASYDERDYELLLRNLEVLEDPARYAAAKKVHSAGMPWINSRMPNRKTDTNNRMGFSTDFIGRNYRWAEASYEEREQILKAHLDYQRGLMWTLANHPRVPERIRREVSRWGTCRDEFKDGLGDGWQSQLYVREARRMVGETVMTEKHCRHLETVGRSVGMAAYNMDSHHVRRYVDAKGFVQNEGDVEIAAAGPYPIDYGAIVPKRGDCRNLFVPVCVSASHIAFGSIRMEPVFFALGQSAGAAAALAIETGVDVQDVDYAALRERLLKKGQVLDPAGKDAALKPASACAAPARGVPAGCDPSVMSEKYWQVWNADVQAKLDADIEANRKSDAVFAVPAPDGTEVKVEQVTSEFVIGAHIFNFDQLGRKEWNDAYKKCYGPDGVFNSATVAFYWDRYEPTPGAPRVGADYGDTESFWNSLSPAAAAAQPRWRRPSPGPVIRYLKGRGVRVHGHVLVWGSAKPSWIWDLYCPADEKLAFSDWGLGTDDPYATFGRSVANYTQHWRSTWQKIYRDLSEDEIAARLPVFAERQRALFRNRVKSVAAAFGDIVDSWDVVNESSVDWARYHASRTGRKVWKSVYGLMPGDYPLDALLDAKEFLPPSAKLNINDYNIQDDFLAQVADLEREGAKIDIVGCQMHIFNTNDCMRLAYGATNVNWVGTPATIRKRLDMMAKAGKPIHVSEVTITSPGPDDRCRQIQAILARNIYRAWFAHPDTMGVTWWNTVDRCGAKGEPLVSGLFTRDMQKKRAYLALDELVNREWKTSLKLKVKDGKIAFRGFRGKYRLTWKDTNCFDCRREAVLTKSGGDSRERFAEVTASAARYSEMPADVAKPLGERIAEVTARGAFGEKTVKLAEGEQLFDVGKIAGVTLEGTDGAKEPGVTLSFNVYAADAKIVWLEFTNDWYGKIFVNGKLAWKVDGPTGAWGTRPLKLVPGENRIDFETHHGLCNDWLTGLSIVK